MTASNLAVSLALAGQRVVLVDADFRRPRIHTYMRVSNAVGLSSVLARAPSCPMRWSRSRWRATRSGGGEAVVPEALVREGAPVRVMSTAGSGAGA